jgi:lipopolysaccharide export LptBFGC system permease protein LptF
MLFAVFVGFWLIPTINDVIMDRTVAKLEHLTEVPLTVLQKYDAMVDKGTLTLEEAQQGAMEEIRVYRFNTDDYFFINS